MAETVGSTTRWFGSGVAGVIRTPNSLQLNDGTEANPAVAPTSDPDTGWRFGIALIFGVAAGSDRFVVGTGGVSIRDDMFYGFSSNSNPEAINDVQLHRDNADKFAQKRGGNAQAWRVYNVDSGADDEFFAVDWITTSNVALVGTDIAGTGSGRDMGFQVGGARAWTIPNTSKHFQPQGDNLQDLGTIGLRVRSGVFGTSIAVGTNAASAGALRLANGGAIEARNVGDSGNIELMVLSAGNIISIGGDGTGITLGSGILTVGGDLNHDGPNVGFYGTAPIAQQAGVAVTAAGIHAACVALGLFTA